jgi:hypothetical protein
MIEHVKDTGVGLLAIGGILAPFGLAWLIAGEQAVLLLIAVAMVLLGALGLGAMIRSS